MNRSELALRLAERRCRQWNDLRTVEHAAEAGEMEPGAMVPDEAERSA